MAPAVAIQADAIARWARRQREILSEHYDAAWQRGVGAYVPDDDPPAGYLPDESEQRRQAAAGHGSVAAVLARRHRPYVPPKRPSPRRKSEALAGALSSIDKMVGEVNDAQTRAAEPLPAPGSHDPVAEAVARWGGSNDWRLMMGAGVIWAAEQAGFAAAANADGQLLIWICQDDPASCQDCLDMAEMPPMPENDWPALPGGGGTACYGNCRCVMDYAPVGAIAYVGE